MARKVGDVVTIIRDGLTQENFPSPGVNETMIKFMGKQVTIARIYTYDSRRRYRINEDGEKWAWIDGMFEDFDYTIDI